MAPVCERGLGRAVATRRVLGQAGGARWGQVRELDRPEEPRLTGVLGWQARGYWIEVSIETGSPRGYHRSSAGSA